MESMIISVEIRTIDIGSRGPVEGYLLTKRIKIFAHKSIYNTSIWSICTQNTLYQSRRAVGDLRNLQT